MLSMDVVEHVAVCLCWGQTRVKNFPFSCMHKKWLRGCCSERAAYQVWLRRFFFNKHTHPSRGVSCASE